MIETTHEDVRKGKHNINKYMVYAIYDDDGKCAYVGSSKNIKQRFASHLSYSKRKRKGVYILFNEKLKNYKVYLYTPKELIELFEKDKTAKISHALNFRYKKNIKKREAIKAEWILWYYLKPYLNQIEPC